MQRGKNDQENRFTFNADVVWNKGSVGGNLVDYG